MRRLPLAVALVLALAQRAEPQEATKLTPEWTSVWGLWEVDAKNVITGRGFIRYEQVMPPNFIFRGTVRLEPGGEGGEGGTRFEITFRRSRTDEWPSYRLLFRPDRIALVRWGQQQETLAEVRLDLPMQQWIKIELRVKGGKIEARIANKIRLQADDPKPIENDGFLIIAVGYKAGLKDLKMIEAK